MVEHHKQLYIYHHLGLGDHIICNGIVRNIYKYKTQNLSLFCKPKYCNSVQYLYRDTNIKIIPKDDYDVVKFLSTINNLNKIFIGHHHLINFINEGLSFDKAFYKQIGLNFKKRWSDFYVQRDVNRENTLYEKINPNKEYIFLHEDKSRNLLINRNFIENKNIQIIEPDIKLTQNIFEYIKIIENAKEIHCIDSCFRLLVDSILKENTTTKLYYHLHLLNNNIKDTTFSQSRLNWNII